MREAEIELVNLANTNEADIAQEILDRKAADNTLQNNINTEATTREEADTTLQNNITAEASARETADTTLQNNINAEETARKKSDATLQSNITAEANAREQADTTLQNNINSEETARKKSDATLQSNITAEANAREQADTTLQNNINSEETARNQEDSKLQSGIDEINAKFPVATDNIADNAITSNKIADGTISAIELDSDIQNQLSFLASLPAMEFGTSDSFDIQANSYYDCTVTFNTKTTIPIVLCGLQHETGNMSCTVTSVTNQQFSVRVFNLTATDITAAKIYWLAISGR
jgi:hypothetical protein